MKRLVLILLLVIFVLVLSGCNDSSVVADPAPAVSAAESSAAAESAPAEPQAGSAVDAPASSESSAVSSAPAASDTPTQAAASGSAAPSGAAGIPNPTHDIPLPARIPDYTTAENIMRNTLSATYNGERLVSIHALDVKNHLTARYSIASVISSFDERDFAALLENADAAPKAADRAFILFTDKGRHYIYLDQTTSPELTTIWEKIYSEGAPKNIHWLTHMTTSRIVKISFNGWSQGADTLIALTVEDRATIEQIADHLKHALTVNAEEPIRMQDGGVNPLSTADTYDLTILFDNGVRYFLIGHGDFEGVSADGSGLGIYTSDLDKSIFYTLSVGVSGRLRDFMEAQQLSFWQKNGDPTRLNVKILNAAAEKLVYSKDLKVPLRIENGSGKAISVTTAFATQRHRPEQMAWEDILWGEGHSGEVTVEIPAKSSAVVEVPFSAFALEGNGSGKYRTAFRVNQKFKIFGQYAVESAR